VSEWGRFLAALMTVAALTCTAAAAQDRVALVVGNSKYVSVNVLPNASTDRACHGADATRDRL